MNAAARASQEPGVEGDRAGLLGADLAAILNTFHKGSTWAVVVCSVRPHPPAAEGIVHLSSHLPAAALPLHRQVVQEVLDCRSMSNACSVVKSVSILKNTTSLPSVLQMAAAAFQ